MRGVIFAPFAIFFEGGLGAGEFLQPRQHALKKSSKLHRKSQPRMTVTKLYHKNFEDKNRILIINTSTNMKKFFEGRLTRKPYLVKTIFIVLSLSIFGGVLGAIFGKELFFAQLIQPLVVIGLILIIPITTKRLHDIGYSGWVAPIMMVIGSIFPLVGIVFSLCLFFWPSKTKDNRY